MSRTAGRAGLLVAAALVAVVASAGTKFASTWKAPGAGPLNFQGKKVAALVIHNEQSVRYGSEDALAQQITARGAVGIAAYSLIPKELMKDKEKAKEFLQKANVAGVIAMRVVNREKDVTSTPGNYWGATYYSSFWAGGGYYGYAWGGVYDPTYIRTDTLVSVETLVYSMDQDKLVWAALSETTNPKKVGDFVKDLTKKVASELKKEGLIR